MILNLSHRYPKRVCGGLILLTILSSVGVLAYYGDSSENIQQPTSEEEDHKEMKKWSSSLRDQSHKNFNPFLWNHTPDEFGYKK